MKNTNYILELVIAGLGTLTWLLILLVTFIDVNWVNIFVHIKQNNVTGLMAIYSVLLLPFIYVNGVVADRVVDGLFDRLFGNRIVNTYFVEKNLYTEAIARIFYSSDRLKENYEYTRMRVRICRVWSFNAFLCCIAMNLFLFTRFEEFDILHKYISPDNMNVWTLSLYSSFFFLSSSFISYRAWYMLSKKECIIIKAQNAFLLTELKSD